MGRNAISYATIKAMYSNKERKELTADADGAFAKHQAKIRMLNDEIGELIFINAYLCNDFSALRGYFYQNDIESIRRCWSKYITNRKINLLVEEYEADTPSQIIENIEADWDNIKDSALGRIELLIIVEYHGEKADITIADAQREEGDAIEKARSNSNAKIHTRSMFAPIPIFAE